MTRIRETRRSWAVAAALAAVVALGLGVVQQSAGAAETAAPWWHLTLGTRPMSLSTGGTGVVFLDAENLGDASTEGPVTITDVLPGKLKVVDAKGIAGYLDGERNRGPVVCKTKESTVTCTFGGEYQNENKELVAERLPPYETIEVAIAVSVKAGASSAEESMAIISGGGAARAVSVSRPLSVGEALNFGFEDFEMLPEEAGGQLDAQAGSHPFQFTTVVSLNQAAAGEGGEPHAVGEPRDIVTQLPVGMFGNPTPFTQCTDAQFSVDIASRVGVVNNCPASSAVGVASVLIYDPTLAGDLRTLVEPIFNLVPLPGEPARFGFKPAGVPVYLDTSVQSGGNYAVSVGSHNISEEVALSGVRLTFWGVPGDKRHDAERGWECLYGYGTCPPSTAQAPPPLLVMPTYCGAPFAPSVTGDTWSSFEHPSESAQASYTLPEPLEGCNRLQFEPQIRVTPDKANASSASGLTVDVHVPQEAALNPEGLAESTLKDTTVALPEGVAVNPSGGDGLEGCSEDLAGFLGVEEGGLERDLFTPRLPGSHSAIEAGEFAPLAPGSNFCSNASKIATAVIHTPLLPHAIEGAVYIASQNANPFGALVALYLIAEDPVSGTVIKLIGEVTLNPSTGQLVTTFKNTPELPFEDLELHFFGESRAPLATPARCGSYTTQASFTPWSGGDAVNSESAFQITSGPNDSPCPGASLPFKPSLTGGAIDNNGGTFSALSTTIGREDGEQNMQSVSLNMPPGLSGMLSAVKLCPEAQANEGDCGPESLIGETTVSAGVGSDPVAVKGGKVYITEKYEGAPYGLSIVNPVKAGPFDLEHDTSKPGTNMPSCDCIVVRAKIEVNPQTAALTVTTDPSGPHAIPHMIDGIPVQIKRVNVLINRPGFTFNPTNCSQMQITGAIGSDEGGFLPVSVPFEVANCATLRFEPSFQVFTQAKTSKKEGASLRVKMSYPPGAAGKDANLKYVKVELPKALPSQLETLKQACAETVFDANPASCPSASVVGHAVVHTPVLPVPLEGPAYFVSHGGKEFPSLTIVLQGDGVTVELVGETYISKGITSSTFNATPDVPFETFELTLPQGKYSALAANGDLCDQKLIMPTHLLAQNGATLEQQTRIAVEGCPSGLAVIGKKAKGRTLTLQVVAPAAGTLKASGNGLSSAGAAASGREPLTITLRAGARAGSRDNVKLVFQPAQGKRLVKTVTLSLGRGR